MIKKFKAMITLLLSLTIITMSSCNQEVANSLIKSQPNNSFQSSNSKSDLSMLNPTPTIKPIKFKNGLTGTTSGNLFNGEYYTESASGVMNKDGDIYISLFDKDTLLGNALYMIKGGNEIKLLDDKHPLLSDFVDLELFNIVGDYLYFCYSINTLAAGSTNGFFSMDLKSKKLDHYAKDETIISMLVIDDWIFYVNGEKELNAMQTDGTKKRKIAGITSLYFYVYANRIFYLNYENQFLYSSNLDGTDQKIIYDKEITCFCIENDWIYVSHSIVDHNYDTSPIEAHISKLKPDGSQVTKISDDGCRNLNVSGAWIYYSIDRNNYDRSSLYRIKTDGTNKERMSITSNVNSIGVFGNRIIFTAYLQDDMYEIYSITPSDAKEKLLRGRPQDY